MAYIDSEHGWFTPVQSDLNWAQTFRMTLRAPAIANRIFDTLEHAQAYIDDYSDKASAVPGIVLCVTSDSNVDNNGMWLVLSVKDSSSAAAGIMRRVDERTVFNVTNLTTDLAKYTTPGIYFFTNTTTGKGYVMFVEKSSTNETIQTLMNNSGYQYRTGSNATPPVWGNYTSRIYWTNAEIDLNRLNNIEGTANEANQRSKDNLIRLDRVEGTANEANQRSKDNLIRLDRVEGTANEANQRSKDNTTRLDSVEGTANEANQRSKDNTTRLDQLAEPNDYLFEQADSVRGNDTDIERSSKSFANPANDIKILDEAEAMPDHIMVDLTDNSTRFATWDGSKSAWMDTTSLLDSQFFDSGSTVDKAMFRGSQLSGSGPISTGFGYSAQFRITTGLPFSVNLRKQIDRVIIASSPFWLSAHSDLQDEAEGISYKNSKNRFAGFFTSRKAIGIPEEAALLVYKDYEDTIRLHDRLHFYQRQLRYFFNRSWMYSETNVLKEMSLSYNFLMGRSYSELKQRFNGSPDYLYSLTGSVDVDQVSYDAFFGCFPYCMLSAACLENGNIAMYMWKTGDFTDTYIPIPRMRVFFPKNEIIRKIKHLIADGAIDEYGNELTT